MGSKSTKLLLVALIIVRTGTLTAQTDYYNTDAGRPVLIEDAHPVERYAFEAQVAPLRVERTDEGAYHWEFEPELAYGILPGMQIEAGLHLDFTDQEGAGRDLGLEGVEVAVLRNLNVETRTLPALAVAGELLIPAGKFARERVYPSLKGIVTRTFRPARIHLNASYTFGPGPSEAQPTGELARWLVGMAIDKALPLSGALLIADGYLESPLPGDGELEWTVEGGARYQLDPFFALDLGVGRRFTGDDPAWFLTLGAARTFAIRALIPAAR